MGPQHPVAELERCLRGTRGHVGIRLTPGLWLDISAVMKSGLSAGRLVAGECSTALGLDSGEFGPYGVPRLLQLLTEARLRDGKGSLGPNTLNVQAFLHSYKGATEASLDPPIAEILGMIGVKKERRDSLHWKDTIVDGSIEMLPGLLADRTIVFVGAPRTRPFSEALGVRTDNFIAIPDSDAYELAPAITAQVEVKLLSAHDVPILMHAATTIGHVVCLELCLRGVNFVGVDLGLAATVFDLEYLATRPWFGQYSRQIIQSAEILSRFSKHGPYWHATGQEDLSPNQVALKTLEFGIRWRDFERAWQSSPEDACAGFAPFLTREHSSLFPIASAGLVLNQERFAQGADPDLVDLISNNHQVFEVSLALSSLMASREDLSEAASYFLKASRLSPLDSRLSDWRKQLDRGGDLSAWDAVLTQPGRVHFASRVTWALHGDLASGAR